MGKYLLLKHCRGAPAAINDGPMDQWAPAEIDAHMQDFADRLKTAANTSTAKPWPVDGAWVRSGGRVSRR